MKQYRITSDNFVLQGETGDTDAVMNAQDLAEIKKLAGITGLVEGEGQGPAGLGGVYDPANNIPNSGDSYSPSPVGSNVTDTAAYRNELLEKYDARPGDWLWFMINFEPVRGLGEGAGHLEDKIKEYLDKHPELRPENRPQLPGYH